jgi:hypothetical protein
MRRPHQRSRARYGCFEAGAEMPRSRYMLVILATLLMPLLLASSCGSERGAPMTRTNPTITSPSPATPAEEDLGPPLGEEEEREGGGVSLRDYFQRIDAVFGEAVERVGALQREFDAALAAASTDEEEVEAGKDYMNASAALADDVFDALSDMSAPAKAEGAHNELIASEAAVDALFGELVVELANVQSGHQLQTLLAETKPRFVSARERLGDACSTLQEIANDNGTDVDLECYKQ